MIISVCIYILLGIVVFIVFSLSLDVYTIFFLYGDNNCLWLTIPYLHIKKISFTSDSQNHIDILDPNFVTGLTDGEGSFSITKHKETKAKLEYQRRTRNTTALTEYALSATGHRMLCDYLQTNDPQKYNDVYVNVNSSTNKPAYWKLNLNNTLLNRLRQAN